MDFVTNPLGYPTVVVTNREAKINAKRCIALYTIYLITATLCILKKLLSSNLLKRGHTYGVISYCLSLQLSDKSIVLF